MNKIYSCLFAIAILVLCFLNAPALHAEGSKDLYPEGVSGNRAFLVSMTGDGYAFNPFNTLGRHMVYAKVGETIYVGSSSQGFGNGTINLYTPNGTLYTSGNNTSVGRIQNRSQEKAGPLTATNPTGYTPFTRVVQSGEEGIWVIEFYARGTNMSGAQSGSGATQEQNTTVIALSANANWTTTTTDNNTHINSAFITAWDVTIGSAANPAIFIPGRVYTTVFNLGMSAYTTAVPSNPDGFFGKLYGLTRDGFSYLVDHNGHNGLSFNTFINNKGSLVGGTGINKDMPDYKSFTYSGAAGLRPKFHDPRVEDEELHVTHKMFFGKPASDMPETAPIWQPSGGTRWPEVWNATTGGQKEVWLKPVRGSIIPKELELIGVEGIEGYYTSKGANFVFNSEVEGRYNITIPAANPANNRVLEGDLYLGRNEVYWDGLDNVGNFMLGENLSNVSIRIVAAEVHFPFIDVENNVRGISIQALNELHEPELSDVDHDKVWWNIDGLTGNLLPADILKNNSIVGHNSLTTTGNLRWGVNGGGNNFGDSKAIVEWINQTQLEGGKSYNVTNLQTDLEVVEVTRESSSFKVKIKNNGPDQAIMEASGDHSATFMFFLPMGLTVNPAEVGFTTTAGTISYNGAMAYTDVAGITDPAMKVSQLQVKLNMSVGAEGIFEIPFSFDGTFIVETVNAWGTIMRAHDVTDPNAFNTDLTIQPTNPFEQANGIQKNFLELNLNSPVATNPQFANLQAAIDGTILPGNPNYTNNIKYSSFSAKNYWYGTVSNEWAVAENWSKGYVPFPGQNVVFSTTANNIENLEYPDRVGNATRDLWLDDTDQNGTGGRVVGDFENATIRNLIITTGNQLTVNGRVIDGNPASGTIIVKADNDNDNPKINGTLLFTNPGDNPNVQATVEFYNKAYECDECGFFRRQWQYFGIPVKESDFPYQLPVSEEVNQWVESYNGNKWRPAPFTPDSKLKAFKGYEISAQSTSVPTHIYSFTGILHTGDASVPVYKSTGVNYAGLNLIGNSYTAAIPISKDALVFTPGLLVSETVFLYNTGTRDQWRKLDGSVVSGVSGGQYQAVPFMLAGMAGLPEHIPSMHTFMLQVASGGVVDIKYSELSKSVATATTPAWRAPESAKESIPFFSMEIYNEAAADKVWVFERQQSTTGVDNGWDGTKIDASESMRLVVNSDNAIPLQVATVPSLIGTSLSFSSQYQDKVTISFNVSEDVEARSLYLVDQSSGAAYLIRNNVEYQLDNGARKSGRFEVVESPHNYQHELLPEDMVEITEQHGIVTVTNHSPFDCNLRLHQLSGAVLQSSNLSPHGASTSFDLTRDVSKGVYLLNIRTNAGHSFMRKVIVQ